MFIGPGRTGLVIVRTRRARGPCFTVIGAGWSRLVIIPIRSAIPAIIIAIMATVPAVIIAIVSIPAIVIITVTATVPAVIIAIVSIPAIVIVTVTAALIAIVIIAIATQSVHELLAASLHVLLQGFAEILKSLRLRRPGRRKRQQCCQSHGQGRHFQNFKSAVLHSHLSSLFRLS